MLCIDCEQPFDEADYNPGRGKRCPPCVRALGAVRARRLYQLNPEFRRREIERMSRRERKCLNTPEQNREASRKATALLMDGYVKQSIVRDTELSAADVPDELLELKRAYLNLYRALCEVNPRGKQQTPQRA